jgi:hypothetical protein
MDSDDDDYGPTPFPILVRVAGVLWLCFGSIGLLGAILGFVLNTQQAGGGAGKSSPVPNCCGMLIPIVFLHVGLQTVQGKAKDTLGNGIGSIVFGMFYLAVAGVFIFLENNAFAGKGLGGLGMVVGLIAGLFGLLLLLAGTMALVSRTQYKAWRRENQPAKRRRRREDEEDEDDR